MLLRNYDNSMNVYQMVRGGNFIISLENSDFGDKSLTIKQLQGGVSSLASTTAWYYAPLTTFQNYENDNPTTSQGYSTLIVGSGDTPVTYDDYNLASVIPSTQLAYSNYSQDYEYNEETNEFISTYKKIYTAKSDVIIKEIGISSSVYTKIVNSGYTSALMYREVLETPIEVSQGSNVIITFTKKQSLNQNKPTDYVATASVE